MDYEWVTDYINETFDFLIGPNEEFSYSLITDPNLKKNVNNFKE